MRSKVIIKDPGIMGGTPVFKGTRVPLQVLLDYLESGKTIEDFIKGYPAVSKKDIISVLSERRKSENV